MIAGYLEGSNNVTNQFTVIEFLNTGPREKILKPARSKSPRKCNGVGHPSRSCACDVFLDRKSRDVMVRSLALSIV